MKPFANHIPKEGYVICHECGFAWKRGYSGNHSCIEQLQKKIQSQPLVDETRLKLDRAVTALIPLARLYKEYLEDNLEAARYSGLEGDDPLVCFQQMEIVYTRGGKGVLTIEDTYQAMQFFTNLGIDI